MASKNTLDMTQGPIVKKLFAFAVPLIFTLVIQQLYTLADRVVVGRFAVNGKDALAAIGATGSITTLLLNLSNGLSAGVNVRCSNLRGAGEEGKLRKSIHTSILLSVVIGVALGVLGIFVSRPMLRLLDTPESILDQATLYMQIYFAAIPATSIYNFGAAVLRSHGDSKRPMYILTFSGILNVVLNLVLVCVFKMAVEGVAIATAVAQIVAAFCVVWILFDPKDAYKLTAKELGFHGESLKVIVHIGVPAGINGMLFSLSNLTVQSAINSFDSTAIIAGRTAATDVGSLIFQVMHAFELACVSFAGQCYGAKKYKRIDKLLVTAILCCGAIIAVLASLVTVFSEEAIGLFNSDPEVIAAGKNIMLIMVWGYMIFNISCQCVNCTRGMGRSVGITLMNIAGVIVPRVVWVLVFFPMHRTVEFLYLCFPISFVVSSITQVIYYKIVRRKLDRQLLQAVQE